MNCPQAKRLIQLHVGDDLNLAETQLLNSHLIQCPVCQLHHSSMRRSMSALYSLRDAAPDPTPTVWPSISSAIIGRATRERSFRRFNIQVAAVSVCSLLLAVVTIVQTLQSLRPGYSDTAAIWQISPAGPAHFSFPPRTQTVANSVEQPSLKPQPGPQVNWPNGAQDF